MTDSEEESKKVSAKLAEIAKPVFGNPSLQGALIIDKILSDPQTRTIWLNEIAEKAALLRQIRLNLN